MRMINKQYTMNNKLPVLLSFLVPIFISLASVSSQFHDEYSYCDDSWGNYTANSIYDSNLKSLFADLTKQPSLSGFGNYSKGVGVDKVNMLYMCRGDLNGVECQSCIVTTIQRVAENCPENIAVIIWQQECMLRYTNDDIFSFEDESLSLSDHSPGNVSNPLPYDEVVSKVTQGLIMQAAYNLSSGGHAAGEGNVSGLVVGSDTVHVYVQCTPDILGARCERCLRAAFRSMAGCCGVKRVWVQLYYPSCQIRYDVVDFLWGFSADPPLSDPPADSTLPPSSPPGSGTATVKPDGNLYLVGFILAVGFLSSVASSN